MLAWWKFWQVCWTTMHIVTADMRCIPALLMMSHGVNWCTNECNHSVNRTVFMSRILVLFICPGLMTHACVTDMGQSLDDNNDSGYFKSAPGHLNQLWFIIHWNGNVIILKEISSLAPELVKMVTLSAEKDEYFIKNDISGSVFSDNWVVIMLNSPLLVAWPRNDCSYLTKHVKCQLTHSSLVTVICFTGLQCVCPGNGLSPILLTRFVKYILGNDFTEIWRCCLEKKCAPFLLMLQCFNWLSSSGTLWWHMTESTLA